MSKPRDDRQKDLLLPALDQIIDMGHPLVRLAALIDWKFLDDRFGSVCHPGPGQPGLPTRLGAGPFILNHLHNRWDEVLCARWIENPYYQYFCGELSFCHRLPFDRSSMTRWRQRLGEEQLVALIQESLSVAHKTGAIGVKDLERVAVDTTVQPKAVAHPTDARLMHRAITKLVGFAKRNRVPLRQSYLRLAKRAAIMVGRYTHAHQFKRARRQLKFLRTRLGRIIRDIRSLRRAHARPVITDMEKLTGVEARRIHVDKGYRGHNHPHRFRVWISGQVRRVTASTRREMKRRAAVEPVIGHVKAEHRMDRNYLKGRVGDRINAVLAAAGYNFGLLLRWLAALLRAIIRALAETVPAQKIA